MLYTTHDSLNLFNKKIEKNPFNFGQGSGYWTKGLTCGLYSTFVTMGMEDTS